MNAAEKKFKIASLERQIADLKNELANLPEGSFIPSMGPAYFTYDSFYGGVIESIWDNGKTDQMRFSLGLVFMSAEDAAFELERRKVIAELKGFTEAIRSRDGRRLHYYLAFDHSDHKIIVEVYSSLNLGYLSFSTREYAEEAIAAIGEDRLIKYYFGIG